MAVDETALTGPAEMSAGVRDEGGVTVISLAGELDLSNAEQLRECLVAPVVLDAKRVEVDLAEVSFLDSSCIGVLVAASKRVRSSGGAFSVRCGEGLALRVLQVAGLVDYFALERSPKPSDSSDN